ncbi:MAG: hypothetical protein DRP01_11305 [Archaeoglobales archaeon]|nr:MAG: hypothetical protein DRP01_11305 [Archaeoglobales archaeon]
MYLAKVDIEKAKEVAKKINDPYWNSYALAEIAKYSAEVDVEKAKEVFEKAIEVVKRFVDSKEKSDVLLRIVESLAEGRYRED